MRRGDVVMEILYTIILTAS